MQDGARKQNVEHRSSEAKAREEAKRTELQRIADEARRKALEESKAEKERLIHALEEEKKARRQAEQRKVAVAGTPATGRDPLNMLDGAWVSVSPPGPHIVFNRISLGLREVSLPNLGQASIRVSQGEGGSNFQVAGSGFTCFYLVLTLNEMKKMVWEFKSGDSVCFSSAVYERVYDPIEPR